MLTDAPLPLRLIGGVPGLSRQFMRTRGTMKAQRAQEAIPEPSLESRIAGVSMTHSSRGTSGS